MTFQVGTVGRDGVLLASDCQCTSIDAITFLRQTYKTTKLNTTPDGRFAYCCAGGAWADQTIATFLGGHTHPIRENLASSSHLVWQRDRKQSENPFWKGSILLVERTEQNVGLWHVDSTLPCNPQQIQNRKTQGDDGNPAQFFLERYFKEVQKVDRSIVLAAFTVLMAHKLNKNGVDGSEMLVCAPSGFSLVSTEKIIQLRNDFEKFDSAIAANFEPNA